MCQHADITILDLARGPDDTLIRGRCNGCGAEDTAYCDEHTMRTETWILEAYAKVVLRKRLGNVS